MSVVESKMKFTKSGTLRLGAGLIVFGLILLGIDLLSKGYIRDAIGLFLIGGGALFALLSFSSNYALKVVVLGIIALIVGLLLVASDRDFISFRYGPIWIIFGAVMIIVGLLTLRGRRPVSKLERARAKTSTIFKGTIPPAVKIDERKAERLKDVFVSYKEMLSLLREAGVDAELVEQSAAHDIIGEERPDIMVNLKKKNIDRIKITTSREGVETKLYIHHLVYAPAPIDDSKFETNLSWVKKIPIFGKVKGVKWEDDQWGSLLNRDADLTSLLLSAEKESIRRQREREPWGFYRRFFESFHLHKRPQMGAYVDKLDIPSVGTQWLVDIVASWSDILTRQRKIVSEGLYSEQLFNAVNTIAGHIRTLM